MVLTRAESQRSHDRLQEFLHEAILTYNNLTNGTGPFYDYNDQVKQPIVPKMFGKTLRVQSCKTVCIV